MIETIEELEERIQQFTRAALDARRSECDRSQHEWFELRTNTMGSGPASYCARCLVLRLANFDGWPVLPSV